MQTIIKETLDHPEPFYLPESEAVYFLKILEKNDIPFTFTHYEKLEDKEKECHKFQVPPFELNIWLKRLSRICSKVDPETLEDAFYEMLESDEYLLEVEQESAWALEEEKNYNQPGIWVASSEH